MPIRVTQHMMYHNMVNQMQSTLSAYTESNEQASTQKRINRPSDDPVGMYRVLTSRNAIASTEQYEENANTALGWLQLADNTLSTQVTTVITQLKELAEQAATGTYDAVNRQQMAYQARELFGSLLNLANTEFDGSHLFGGHVYDQPAFEMGLAVTTWDPEWQSAVDSAGNTQSPPPYVVTGATDKSIVIQFTEVGNTPTSTPGDTGEVVAGSTFRWSDDGGETWHDGTVTNSTTASGSLSLDAGGVILTLPPKDASTGTGFTAQVADLDLGPGAGHGADGENTNGTLLYIRPTAIYMGDDNDPPPDVTFMGNTVSGITATPQGTFSRDVLLRMDSVNAAGDELTYSYSTDNGSTWIQATTAIPSGGVSAADPLRLTVPGGYLDLDAMPSMGAQIKIHPHRADLDYEIMKDTFLTVNNVGKDIFGGYYNGAPALVSEDGDISKNLFEVVGNFIAYLENNNQEGCQRTLPALTEAENVILTAAARIGGKENRVETALNLLSFQKIDQQEQLSNAEDIDLTELLVKLTQQQMAYSTVLKSSSMIMQLSLVNYV